MILSITTFGGAATHQSGNSSKRELIKAATHQSGNSSKRQLIEYPLEVPFIKKYL
jgi:hypothetical protein